MKRSSRAEPMNLPVLVLGEEHDQIEHQLIEKEALEDGRRYGYRVFAIEIQENYQIPWETYLRSARTGEDKRLLFHTLFPKHKTPPANLARLISLAEYAAKQGYRLLCIDIPSASWGRQEGESVPAWISRRNRHMADRIAEDLKENRQGILVQTGMDHVLTARKPPDGVYAEKPQPLPRKGEYTPLSTALKHRGVHAISYILAVEGEETARLVRASWTQSHLITDAEEIARSMRKEYARLQTAGFRRVASAPETTAPPEGKEVSPK